MTLREMYPFVRFRIGGLVVARSVKYLGKITLGAKRAPSSTYVRTSVCFLAWTFAQKSSHLHVPG